MEDNSNCAGINEIFIITKIDSIEFVQILMSVRMILEGVIKIVTTMLAPTTVPVKMAMNWLMIITLVQVKILLDIIISYELATSMYVDQAILISVIHEYS